jgi:TRAP-type mannitol/chloroaromatic compound transport system permease small subunit
MVDAPSTVVDVAFTVVDVAFTVVYAAFTMVDAPWRGGKMAWNAVETAEFKAKTVMDVVFMTARRKNWD